MMRRDPNQTNYLRKRVKKNTTKRVIYLFIIFIFLFVGFITWKKHANVLQIQHVMSWLTTNKKIFKQNLNKVKTIAKTEDDNQENKINFEFYTTLPNMKIGSISQPNNTIAEKETRLIEHKKIALNEINTSPNMTDVFLKPDELEKEFAKDIKTKQYIVQIASFRSLESATEIRDAFLKNNFNVTIAKIIIKDQQLYRVQLGPFSQRSQAEIALNKLARKGKYGILRKI